jgi:5-formyltetrahydrofolate cyclo-ligase
LSKNSIRRPIRERRDAIGGAPHAAATEQICAGLLKLDVLRDVRNWFVYVSANSEVGTHELIRTLLSRGNIVTVPRVTGPQEIIAQQITSFAILAPPPGEAFRGGIDVCICPGIAFSENGDRLGSGRGYYDRYLSAHPPRITIGLAFECQIVKDLPAEPHDRSMDWIITERRIIHVDRASR